MCGECLKVERLAVSVGKSKARLVRVGHPARLLPSVLAHCLDAKIESNDGMYVHLLPISLAFLAIKHTYIIFKYSVIMVMFRSIAMKNRENATLTKP